MKYFLKENRWYMTHYEKGLRNLIPLYCVDTWWIKYIFLNSVYFYSNWNCNWTIAIFIHIHFLQKKPTKTQNPPAYPIACHFFVFIFFVNLYAVIVIDEQVDHNLKEHIIFSVLIIYFKIFLSYCFCCHQVN